MTSLRLQVATPEEIQAARADTPENRWWWRSQRLSAKATAQRRDEAGRFVRGYVQAES